MSDKIIALAKKLKALAEQGEGGEKMNAERMLYELMEKHSISQEDLNEDILSKHWFRVRKEQQILFAQLAAHIRNNIKFWKCAGRKGQMGVDLTVSEALTLHAMFEWYWRLFKEEQQTLFVAFVMKHKIYQKSTGDMESELSKDEIEKYMRASELAKGLQDKSFQKRIGA